MWTRTCLRYPASIAATPVNEAVLRAIAEASRTKQTGVSLSTLLAFGRHAHTHMGADTFVTAAQFLKRELPIRFAHRIVELDNLPHNLNTMPSIRRVSEWYKRSFAEIRSFPAPHDAASERAFTALLQQIYERHNPTLVMMAKGIFEFRKSLGVAYGAPLPAAVEQDVHNYLDVFFTSRVGIRTLISQHLALHTARPSHVGIIHTQCRPASVIDDAIADARIMCERNYGDTPDIELYGDKSFVFAFVPSFIHHIVFELMKNSMRATMESQLQKPHRKLPPVKVIMSASSDSEDVVIKISDEGGGIPRSGMRRIFSYFYTTAPPQFREGEGEEESGADFSKEIPMAGLGVGLPLSRVYARYFGGDLNVMSMEGYGTDAYIFLKRLGDAAEPLSECLHGLSPEDAVRALAHMNRPTPLPISSSSGGHIDSSPSPDPENAAAAAAAAEALAHPHPSFRISIKATHVHSASNGDDNTVTQKVSR